MRALVDLLKAFAGIRMLVVGDSMLDRYIVGNARRLCPEAPAPVVAVSRRTHVPGGAANTALNVTALGGACRLVSILGDDLEADELEAALLAGGMDTTGLLRVRGRRSLSKNRVMVDSQLIVRFDEGDTGPPEATQQRRLLNALYRAWPHSDSVVISDYGYGVLSDPVIAALKDLQRREPKVIVADSKRLSRYRELRPRAVKPNYAQAAALIDAPAEEGPRRIEPMAEQGHLLLERTGAEMVAITMDSDGALFIEAGREPYRTYARAARSVQASGAGDTFAAALALALAAGGNTPAAAELASAAAAEVLGSDQTATCLASAVSESFAAQDKRVYDLNEFARRVADVKVNGGRIVFTNGCFDILHRGHVAFLSRAKSLGDILVVGVNSDAGVRRLKGSDRPVNPLEDRLALLAALSCVDHVVPFADDTPIELIRSLRPNVFVKGGDYGLDELPEIPVVEELGGSVHILPYLENHSTTFLVERIRRPQSAAASAEEVTYAG